LSHRWHVFFKGAVAYGCEKMEGEVSKCNSVKGARFFSEKEGPTSEPRRERRVARLRLLTGAGGGMVLRRR